MLVLATSPSHHALPTPSQDDSLEEEDGGAAAFEGDIDNNAAVAMTCVGADTSFVQVNPFHGAEGSELDNRAAGSELDDRFDVTVEAVEEGSEVDVRWAANHPTDRSTVCAESSTEWRDEGVRTHTPVEVPRSSV